MDQETTERITSILYSVFLFFLFLFDPVDFIDRRELGRALPIRL